MFEAGTTDLSILINHIPEYITAVGALGVAAYGIVEAVGKTVLVSSAAGDPKRDQTKLGDKYVPRGLPFAGFSKVQNLLKTAGPALAVAYGADYHATLIQQYRAGRSKGEAPDTIRQGVRLGISFMDLAGASSVIAGIWGLPGPQSEALAQALVAPASADPAATGLAARFATALDTRVKAAFDAAEEVYETQAQFMAALTAIGLSLLFHLAQVIKGGSLTLDPSKVDWSAWAIALFVGVAAVPLAPVAKDLATSLSNALDALGKVQKTAK